jgi:hypothetical protein
LSPSPFASSFFPSLISSLFWRLWKVFYEHRRELHGKMERNMRGLKRGRELKSKRKLRRKRHLVDGKSMNFSNGLSYPSPSSSVSFSPALLFPLSPSLPSKFLHCALFFEPVLLL